MTREFSTFLDLVRFIAACLVIIYHSNSRDIVAEPLPFSQYGHFAVIVFFVLSGYVIAYITYTKENTLKEYYASRLSRIYSLAIPAILLALLLDSIGERVSPNFYVDKTTHDYWYIRVLSSVLFLNEIWGISIMSFSNVPYWSICYEVWYYILFSIWFFLRDQPRIITFIIVCLFLGPKILLLAPIWMLGVILYRCQRFYHISERTGWILFSISIIAFIVFDQFNITTTLSNVLKDWIGPELHKQLALSKFFLGDYILGPIVFFCFIGVRRIIHRVAIFIALAERPIHALAGYTFSIYIYHPPLILFWAALINGSPKGYGFYVSVMTATVLSIWLLGRLTERRRFVLRKWLRTYFTQLGTTGLFSKIGTLLLKTHP